MSVLGSQVFGQALMESCVVQLSWPGLPGVGQHAGIFSLSLLAHGGEAGEEEKEGEMEMKKEGGSWGHLEHQGCK